ncbi:DUF4097 family beta strand repeat-containing protein [Nocardioides sp. TF02-7]|uniref:DUF4097 family beta strand repeat-containing protein n=1 Tax=Nocardioides sp. TF02-7 TaxID=2917724 RepID=UPI001F06C759|nr:DUF4097 family beta strand repeat-containing protein [Nocardioides sp. TF02-7]UMG92881.1 DUF4097 domain-containing protein [Nocardioides sp. TF02-7]
MNKTLTYGALGMFALGLLVGCGSSLDEAAPETRTFQLDGTTLSITTDNGAVELETGDVDEVDVTRWFDGDADQGTWDLEGNTLTLDSSCGLLRTCDARYLVVVPDDVTVDIEGENSPVTARNVSQALTIRTQNGEVTVTGITGDLDLRTDNAAQQVTSSSPATLTSRTANGDVEIALDEPPAELTATADNGRITVALPGDVAYDVEINTGNGHIDNELDIDPDSPHRIRIETDNGDVALGS